VSDRTLTYACVDTDMSTTNTTTTRGAYSVSAYFISRILAEVPLNVIIPTIYATIIYWAVGLNPDPYRYLTFIAVVVLETQCAVAVGYTISAISPDAKVAQAMGPPLLIILILFGGFYINTESLPAGSEWGTIPALTLPLPLTLTLTVPLAHDKQSNTSVTSSGRSRPSASTNSAEPPSSVTAGLRDVSPRAR